VTRLFSALVPSDDALAHLRMAVAGWSEPVDGGRPRLRWTDPTQWHVTLAFYGEIPDGAVPEVEASLGAEVARLPAPTLRLRGAGSFSGRTLWVGVAGEEPADAEALGRLLTVSAGVSADVGAGAEGRERRRAHLTLARAAAGPREVPRTHVTALVRALAVYEGPVWRPELVVLTSSHLGAGRGGGPRYEVVAELPFGGPGTAGVGSR
jgi:2'-5' RNA ligase